MNFKMGSKSFDPEDHIDYDNDDDDELSELVVTLYNEVQTYLDIHPKGLTRWWFPTDDIGRNQLNVIGIDDIWMG